MQHLGHSILGQVKFYGWPDHHPPPLTLLYEIIEDIRQWLEADRLNVAAIHCKVKPQNGLHLYHRHLSHKAGLSTLFSLSDAISLPGAGRLGQNRHRDQQLFSSCWLHFYTRGTLP